MASAHTLIVEPDDGRSLVLQALNAATKSINLTIYELSDPQIMSGPRVGPGAENRGARPLQLVLFHCPDAADIHHARDSEAEPGGDPASTGAAHLRGDAREGLCNRRCHHDRDELHRNPTSHNALRQLTGGRPYGQNSLPTSVFCR